MPDPISPTGSPGQLIAAASAASGPLSANRAVPLEPASDPQTVSNPPRPEDPGKAAEEASVRRARPKPDQATIEGAVQTMREFLKNLPSNLEIRADKETGYIIYKVVNPVTKEVIRQYPPDEMVEMARKMRSLTAKDESGILLDRNL